MGFILSFDPGATTGCTIAEHVHGTEFQVFQSLEYTWQDRFQIFNLIYTNRMSIKAIVIERYRLFADPTTLRSQIGSEIPSARVIGIVELSAKVCKLDCIHFQDPNQRLQVGVLPEHKKLIKRSRHCIDSYLHLRYFILTIARKERTDGE